MNEKDFENALTNVDDAYLAQALQAIEKSDAGKAADAAENAETRAQQKKRARTIVLRVLIAAALILAIAAAGIGTHAAVVEYKEYKTALTFFSENDLEAVGLTREEIKAVYHDIESGTFRLEKTKEVILRRLDLTALAGFEAGQGDLTPEYLHSLWMIAPTLPDVFSSASDSVLWQYDMLEDKDGSLLRGFKKNPTSGSMELVRETELENFDITGVTPLTDGALLFGNPSDRQTGIVAKVDANGKLLWKESRSSLGLLFEYFTAAFERSDGNYVFIGVCRRSDAPDHVYELSFCVYGKDGRQILFTETVLPGVSALVKSAAQCGEDYIVQVYRSPERDKNSILRVSPLGEVCESYAYDNDGKDYFIGDAAMINGKLALTVTAVEKPEHTAGYFTDLREILDDFVSKRSAAGQSLPTSEELTAYFCEHVSALLLYCDPDTGTVTAAGSAAGVIAGKIIQNGGRAESVRLYLPQSIIYLPDTFRRFYGTAENYSYSLNADGRLSPRESDNAYSAVQWT